MGSRHLLLVVAAALMACGSDDSGPGGPKPPAEGPGAIDPNDPAVIAKLAERPWEVVSNKGETYLPNVFYADPCENEQIMPYALDGHVQIDRLVYPTLGNPNLYTKGDASDELTLVLRIEDAAYDFLGAKTSPIEGSPLSRLAVGNDPSTGFAFFLVPRAARTPNTESTVAISSGNGTGVYRIYPNDVLVSPMPADMPERLKARKTLRFVFKQGAMSKVPPGLYDVRFEVRRDNEVYRGVYEYQYNAVRVFDTEPDEYPVINVTDTQVSTSSSDGYVSRTKAKLDEFVQYVNTTGDANVRNAAFITFNGDLHNGGSPGTFRQRSVANGYAEEAKSIVSSLKYLPVPIFLTIGNHDGYVSTGQVPSAVKTADAALSDDLQKVITDASPLAWPGFSYPDFQHFLDESAAADALGGYARDVFTGGFSRSGAGSTFAEGWRDVPRATRNYILYDGFYQWQKTYGPLHYSYRFGRSFYVSLNSFELRQHRRSGWGVYTVNYGGGMSDAQMAWLDREILRAKVDKTDVVLLAHHDPRGGHKGKDLGYYFDQLEFRGVYQSAFNYLVGKVWNGAVCELPDWALSTDQQDSCIHDGLQEWMRPDEQFDCGWNERSADGTCDKALFDPARGPEAHAYWFSGVELLKRILLNAEVRTVLFGHTHYNSLEVLQAGDEILPGQMKVAGAAGQAFATLEIQNPLRGFSIIAKSRLEAQPDYDRNAVPFQEIARRNERFAALLERATPAQRFLDTAPGSPRELVVLRLVSNSDLANQTYQGRSALGFAVLHVAKKGDARAYDRPQINRVTFFVNSGANGFENVRTIDVDRTARMQPHDGINPLTQIYSW